MTSLRVAKAAGEETCNGRLHGCLCKYRVLSGNPALFEHESFEFVKGGDRYWESKTLSDSVFPMCLRSLQGITQRVQLECHYGIRAHKAIYGMVFGT